MEVPAIRKKLGCPKGSTSKVEEGDALPSSELAPMEVDELERGAKRKRQSTLSFRPIVESRDIEGEE